MQIMLKFVIFKSMNNSNDMGILIMFSYDPFGMITVGRNWEVGSEYRYGFNGKESDSETYGDGNIYDYGFRIYNPRLGKFLSVDPLSKSYPWYTPYQFAGNKPIYAIDLDGLEETPKIYIKSNGFVVQLNSKWHDSKVYNFYSSGGVGQDVFTYAVTQRGASVMGGVILAAFASFESDYATGNGGEEYHNLFSIMGGSPSNLGTVDGHLQKYNSWEEGIDGFFFNIDKSWPEFNAVLQKDNISADDINQALNCFSYVKFPAYNGNPSTNEGELIIGRAKIAVEFGIGFVNEKLLDLENSKTALQNKLTEINSLVLNPDPNADITTKQLNLYSEEMKQIESQLNSIENEMNMLENQKQKLETVQSALNQY